MYAVVPVFRLELNGRWDFWDNLGIHKKGGAGARESAGRENESRRKRGIVRENEAVIS